MWRNGLHGFVGSENFTFALRQPTGYNPGTDRSQDWIYEAQEDLEHACSDEERGYYNWACVSAQQAAGKAIKGAFPEVGLGRCEVPGVRLVTRTCFTQVQRW